MKHASIDIETLSTDPYAVVLSIGVCFFDDDQLFIRQPTVSVVVCHSSQDDREVDRATTQWWATQPREARIACGLERDRNAEVDVYLPRGAMLRLAAAFEEHGPVKYVWGWPASFDNTILQTFEFCPWAWHQSRCGSTLWRTLKDAGVEIERVKPERPHHADSDALAQAETIWRCLRYLKELPKVKDFGCST
jgi:hypothetical protein